MQRPPLTVVLYVAIVLGLILALAPSETHPGAATAVLILVVGSIGLILGLAPVWAFLVIVETGNLAIMIFQGQPWWAVLEKAVTVALLLAPSTRRHVRGRRRTATV